MSYRSRGFTLIELLVVISIIALLSSVVLSTLSAAREKGRVGGAQKFNTAAVRGFGADAEGVWNFDEGAGTAVSDFTGNHPGTFSSPTAPTWSNDTQNGKGYSLTFPSGAYVTLANSFSTPTANITISAWVKTTNAGDQPLVSVRGGGNIYFGMGGGRLYVYINNSSTPAMFSTTLINDNKWHHVAWTGNGSRSVIYIDGRIDASLTRTNTAVSPVTAYIARDIEYAPAFVGSLDEVAVFTQTLLAGEIEAIFAKGSAKQEMALEK
jgi:prepilin-type N-terminal cleavage/methylation domain-containing protein